LNNHSTELVILYLSHFAVDNGAPDAAADARQRTFFLTSVSQPLRSFATLSVRNLRA
jgi:hypothetical protein